MDREMQLRRNNGSQWPRHGNGPPTSKFLSGSAGTAPRMPRSASQRDERRNLSESTHLVRSVHALVQKLLASRVANQRELSSGKFAGLLSAEMLGDGPPAGASARWTSFQLRLVYRAGGNPTRNSSECQTDHAPNQPSKEYQPPKHGD
jgi:hypothetical protein